MSSTLSYGFESSIPISTTPRDDLNFTKNIPSTLTSILAAAATGSHLPCLPEGDLKFDTPLGKGASFQVNREIYSRSSDQNFSPYYVAVKRLIVSKQFENDNSIDLTRPYACLAREIRVLTHSSLRDNDCILTIIAYGWTDDYHHLPYLVVDYSDHGTLPEYLKRIKPPLNERRELALDIACGLKALHECKIIHGDVKPNNILVFDTSEMYRPQIAKLADFGASMFEHDDVRNFGYGGTHFFNAPEIHVQSEGNIERLTPKQLYRADIYAYGITLWQMIVYLGDNMSLEPRLGSMTTGRLHEALAACTNSFPSSSDPVIKKAVLDTLKLTIQDNPRERASIDQVVIALTRGTSIARPTSAYPKVRISPPSQPISDSLTLRSSDGVPREFNGYKLVVQTSNPNITVLTNDQVRSGYLPHASRQEGKGLTALPERLPLEMPMQFRPSKIDIFQMTAGPNVPWSVQIKTVQVLRLATQRGDPSESSHAYLQLALCFYIGFGVPPDTGVMLEYFRLSIEKDSESIARIMFQRVLEAIQPQIGIPTSYSELSSSTELDKELQGGVVGRSYFSKRVEIFRKSLRTMHVSHFMEQVHGDGDRPLVKMVLDGDLDVLSHAFYDHSYDENEISEALCISCEQGNIEIALKLCSHCHNYKQDGKFPNPLHWLIYFEDSEVETLANALILGISEDAPGACRNHINSIPTVRGGTFFIPEHCLELFGSPLHWAVRARKLKLVQLLIKLGADVDLRWGGLPSFSSDVAKPRIPNLSPLDIAVIYHLPEIIDELLKSGAQKTGGRLYDEEHSAIHCLGHSCTPLSRQIIHGSQTREALKDTISILLDHGFDIAVTDPEKYNALTIALCNQDCEAYIIEELISAHCPIQHSTNTDGSVAVLAVQNASSRPYNTTSLALVAHRVQDINALDLLGRNALHYAATGNSVKMIEVLRNVNGFDLNCKDSRGNHALHIAAIFDASDVIDAIIGFGADRDVEDARKMSPLITAMLNTRLKAVHTLLRLGANPICYDEKTGKVTVLHSAVNQTSYLSSMIGSLLQVHPSLRSAEHINMIDGSGMTPLHKAAYYGDHEAVAALVGWGADVSAEDKWGKTTLDRLDAQLRKIINNDFKLGIDHSKVRKKGKEEIRSFVRNLEEIKTVLEQRGR